MKVALTATEQRLYRYFENNRGKVCTRDELLTAIWGHALEETRIVDVYIGYLRNKNIKLETVRGVGYLLPKKLEE